MKFRHIIPCFLFLLLLSFQSDRETAGILKWDATAPLTWSDFSGKIDTESPYDAWTYSGFNYDYTWFYEGDVIKVNLNAYAFFDPAQSWVKKDKMTPELLAHEQVHFDVSELHVRYFENELEHFTFTENVQAEIDSVYAVIFERLLAMQIQYDEETEHHQNKEEQLKWSIFIADELERLE